MQKPEFEPPDFEQEITEETKQEIYLVLTFDRSVFKRQLSEIEGPFCFASSEPFCGKPPYTGSVFSVQNLTPKLGVVLFPSPNSVPQCRKMMYCCEHFWSWKFEPSDLGILAAKRHRAAKPQPKKEAIIQTVLPRRHGAHGDQMRKRIDLEQTGLKSGKSS